MALNFLNNGYFAGKVGIGTASPVSILDIFSTAPTLTIGGVAVNQFESGRIRFTEDASTVDFQGSYIHYDGSTNKMHIGVHEAADDSVSNDVNAITIRRVNGYVGIGNVSPGYKLSVNGTIQSDFIRGYTYPNNSFLDFDDDQTASSNHTRLASVGRIAYLADTNANEPAANAAHEFFTGTSDIDTATSLMVIETSGNVGIGTSSPSEKLHVVGNARVTGAYYDSNNSPGTANQVLVSTATGTDWVDGSGSGIIGGPYLPLAGNTTATAMTGDIFLANQQQVRFLTSANAVGLRLQSSGTSSFIDNEVGDMYIRQEADDKDMIFQADDGSGGNATYFRLDGSEQRIKFAEETSFQANTRHIDNVIAGFGNSDDLQIYHDGSNSYMVDAGTGDMLHYYSNDWKVNKYGTSELSIWATTDAGVKLYYDNVKKFETTSTGVTVTGTATATTFSGVVSTGNADGQGNIPFKLSIDYNSYMVAAAGSTWGLFWAGNSGARYGTNGNGGPGNIWGNNGNPNEFVFVGNDSTAWTVYGNTGDTWQSGDIYVGGGDIILSGTGRIQGIDTVTDGTDAANKNYVDTTASGAANWASIGAGTRTNYTLGFQPPSTDYAGFFFNKSDGNGAGYFLVRGGADSDVYKQGGITLVGDGGTLTIATRTSASNVIRFMTGASSVERLNITGTGAFSFGNSVTNYGTSGQVMTSNGNATPGWTTINTGVLSVSDDGGSTINVSGSSTARVVAAITGAVSLSSANLATGAQIQTAINTALTGVLQFEGTWNASTNSPTLSSGTGTSGDYYIVSVAGSTNLDGITDWAIGDWAVFANTTWTKIDNSQVGNVTGSGSSGRVAYWNSNSNITSDGDLLFDGANLTVGGNLTVSGNQYFNGAFIEGDGKEMFRYSDGWLRINEDNDFGSGIYCGEGILRTDGEFQVGGSGQYAKITSAGAGTFSTLTTGGTLTVSGNTTLSGTTNTISGNTLFGGYTRLGGRLVNQYLANLSASGQQARQYEIARAFMDYNDWNNTGVIKINLMEQYFDEGVGKEYAIRWGYNNTVDIDLINVYGGGNTNGFECVLGTLTQIGTSDIYYLPIIVKIRYYANVGALVTTNRNLTTNATSTSGGVIYINPSPTPVNISDFSVVDSVEFSGAADNINLGTASTKVGIGFADSTLPTQALDVNANMRLRGRLYDVNNSQGGSGDVLVSTGSGVDWVSASTPGTGTFLPLIGGTMSGNIVMGDNDITGIDELIYTSGTKLGDNGGTNYLSLTYAASDGGGILVKDGDNTIQGYLYADGGATSSFGLLDGTGAWAVRCLEDQYVELRYDNSVKLQTTSTGVTVTDTVTASKGRFTSTGDASVGSTAHAFQTGLTSSTNIIMDNNEIMARNNGAVSALNFNPDGGDVNFHSNTGNTSSITSAGNATFAGDVNVGDDLNIAGNELTFTNDSASAYLRAADALLIQSDYNTGENKPIYLQPSAVTELTIATGVSTFAGQLTVGSSGTGRDVVFHGDLAGEYFHWDENVSTVNIHHRDELPGLEVYVNGGAQTTQPQLKVGRTNAQYWGAYVDDRNAHLVHRQDEATGTMTTRFDQWDSNTGDTTGNWLWRHGNGTGGSMTNAAILYQSGDMLLYGDLLTDSDSTADLGKTGQRWANIWVDNINGATPAVGANYLPLAGGTMANTNLVTNMNADLLDGLNSGSFLRSDASDTASERIVFSANATNNWDTIATAAGNQGGIEIYNSGAGNDAFMTFHAANDFAFYFGIDADNNQLSIGGWSMGANKYKVWNESNDGAGSGLDADLLDGQQGSYYVNTSTAQSIAGVKSFSGKIGADGGIDGLTNANGGISGSNYNITGVNVLQINDPGEAIEFNGTTTVYLDVIDDAVDDKLRIRNATQLDLNSTARITNLVDPSGAQDAATKTYVDTAVGGVSSGVTSVATTNGITGGTITSTGTIQVDDTVARVYKGTSGNVSSSAYKTAFTVNGGNLSSHIRFSVQGTASNVVISNLIDLAVNHYQDIQLTALSGNYTRLSVKVISNNNEDYEVQFKTNSTNAVTLYLEVFPLGSETITFTSTSSFTGTTGTFADLPYGNYMNGTGGDEGDLFIGGNFTVQGGDIVLNGTGRVQGIDTVSATTDAANKTYVDTAVAGAGSGTFLPLAGGTMDSSALIGGSGTLELGGSGVTNLLLDSDGINIMQFVKASASLQYAQIISNDDKVRLRFRDGMDIYYDDTAIVDYMKFHALGGHTTQFKNDNFEIIGIGANNDEMLFKAEGGGAVSLYHNNVLQLNTTSTGISTNTIDATVSAGSAGNFVVMDGTRLAYRTAAQVLSDIGGTSSSGVTSVATTAPILGGTITSTGTISLRSPVSGNWHNGGAPVVGTDGLMEIGRYIDFHTSNTGTSDYDVRLNATSGLLTVTGSVSSSSNITSTGNMQSSYIRCTSSGTRFAPTFSFTSDTNTGMFRNGTDEVALSAGGNTRVLCTSTYVKLDGNVGIGRVPSTKLDIDGTVLVKDGTGLGDLYLGNLGTNNHFRFHTNNSNTYFDMNCGNMYWRQGSSIRYTFFPSTANMTINGTLTQNSDVRRKENIVEIKDCISKVKAMRGVYYNRTDINTEVTKVGVIAQEVEAVLPEVILESPEDGLKSVAYSELTSVLINAIKEQQEIIEDLKTRITKLEN